MGEGGGGWRSVVGSGASVSKLPPVEGASAGRAPGKPQPVRGGGGGDGVGRGHRVPLASGRHCHTVFFAVWNHRESVCVVSIAANVRVPPGHSCRR